MCYRSFLGTNRRFLPKSIYLYDYGYFLGRAGMDCKAFLELEIALHARHSGCGATLSSCGKEGLAATAWGRRVPKLAYIAAG